MLSLSIFAFPIVTAHTPAWNVPLYAYIHAAPNPIGVNQQTVLVFWFDKPPPSAAGSGGDRWTDIMIEVTKPDGSKENLGPFMSDSVGGAYALYTPSQTGTYSFSLTFDGQTASLYHPDTGIPGAQSDFINDTYYMANTASVSLVVQQIRSLLQLNIHCQLSTGHDLLKPRTPIGLPLPQTGRRTIRLSL